MRINLSLFFIFSVSILSAQNKFSNDALLRKIYNYEYNRQTDSLLPFLNHTNQLYRYAAIKGMSSVQDTNVVSKLLQMLAVENLDSIKMALIYSLGQHDCYVAYHGLKSYYENSLPTAVKWACLEAIGKIAKDDVTDFYAQAFTINTKPDAFFISKWLRGLYLAKRRKQIQIEKNNEQILKCLNKLLENNLGNTNEVNYCYAKIMNQQTAVAAESIKTPVKNLAQIDATLKQLKTPYLQMKNIEQYELSAEVCLAFLASDYHPLIKAHALDIYLSKHSWNNTIDQAFIQRIFDQMDAALTSRMCEYIVAQKQNNKTVAISIDVLQNTQRQLFLPKDFETWVDLEKAILSFEGKTYKYQSCFETGYQNPIDWDYVIKIDAKQKLKITTNKGSMLLDLYVNEAPASVANFLKLVDKGYYNGKYFHRMVPNFVVQGGCPRGDGWGSLDWNQRSELSGSLRYKKGSVGLASAGKDSEGVQFFISHTYAPHLDGKYTIFAEVTEGMDVISNLEIGDQIISIERIK